MQNLPLITAILCASVAGIVGAIVKTSTPTDGLLSGILFACTGAAFALVAIAFKYVNP